MQVEFLLSGLFSRTCRALGHPDKTAAMLAEVVDLREVLVAKYRQVDDNLTGASRRDVRMMTSSFRRDQPP